METIEKLARAKLIIGMVGIDLIVLLGTALLLTEEPRRWPLLLGVGPVLLFVNMIGIHKLKQKTAMPSVFPAIYTCGLLGGLYWTLESFQWWKCIILAGVIFLLGLSLTRRRKIQEERHLRSTRP